MEPHDNALTFIATESELIRTGARQSPTGRRRLAARARRSVRRHSVPRANCAPRWKRERRQMIVNDPETRAEVEALFAAYERALVGNDVAALDGFFRRLRRGDPLRRRPRTSTASTRSAPFAPRARRPGLARDAGAHADHDLRPRSRASPRRCSAAPTRPARSAGRCRPGCGFPRAGASSPRMSA